MIFQTIFVYLLLTVVLFFTARASDYKNKISYILIGTFFYALIFGLRLGVGVDFWAYQEWYESLALWGDGYINFEPGFTALAYVCLYFHLPFSVFLGIIAFLQLALIFLAIRPYNGSYRMLSLTFMLGCIWLSYSNGMRQELAFCIFAYSIQFIDRKSLLYYVTCIIIASLFHTSAIILLVIYPICHFKSEWFHRIFVQLILLLTSLWLATLSVVDNLIEYVDDFAINLGYGVYFEKEGYEFTDDISIGLVFFINLFLNIFLILSSSSVKKYFKSHWVNIIYDLYFVGVLLRYILWGSQLFSRINYYFLGFEFIFSSFVLHYFYKNKRMVEFILLILFYLLIFVATLYRMQDNTALFLFNWQQ